MKFITTTLITLVISCSAVFAQKTGKDTDNTKKTDKKAIAQASTYGALSFRSIGPAVTSGRISDFAVNPANSAEYYVASAAGGVWKTKNA